MHWRHANTTRRDADILPTITVNVSSRSGCHARHATAFFGTALACVGAALAVIHLMLTALDSARFANSCAEAALLVRKARTAAHKCSGLPAGIGTVTIEQNAVGHLPNVFFVEASARTVLALLGTAYAGLDTASEFLR